MEAQTRMGSPVIVTDISGFSSVKILFVFVAFKIVSLLEVNLNSGRSLITLPVLLVLHETTKTNSREVSKAKLPASHGINL
jgi:hypothetical protein